MEETKIVLPPGWIGLTTATGVPLYLDASKVRVVRGAKKGERVTIVSGTDTFQVKEDPGQILAAIASAWRLYVAETIALRREARIYDA